ncbi:N-acetylmuramoyl-L-alanine amidase [Desulfuromusa kysingii]|uniref:N-acetylmuramoyl-L-alanine amidase n=1 Tax=Desulfuromusa kysingii TaxID=37625 RepID=A0A1H4D047_9BACT|nr:N-acetylmuramoyl-L-alanine amidase [Desulfuromusa kysingii]SEA65997.1 N-acetylmuramoyl-L-alanine amidase [Desulfuromusa kysingii]
MRYLVLLLCFFLPLSSAFAAVDIGLRGKDPVRLADVYQQDGVPYVAIEDALDAVNLTGHWNAISHSFLIRSKYGWGEISPASGYLKLGDEFYPLKDKPRFIDGRLRVTDSFVLNQLAQLSGQSVYFRNLDPDIDNTPAKQARGIEKLFAFFLNKKASKSASILRSVAIDPGHGGLDTGIIAPSGFKEKQLNMDVANKLAKQLKMKLGIPIYLSRDGDYEVTMEQRLQAASKEDVDIWLLLHAQASFSAELSGVNLFIRPEEKAPDVTEGAVTATVTSDSMLLANDLALSLRENSIKVRGIYPSSRLSLGRGDLPTVLIELGYLSNPEELQQLQNPDYQNQIIQALYTGIHRYAKKSKEKTNDIN